MGDDARRQVSGRATLGIDPGREKFGVAAIDAGGIIFTAEVPIESADEVLGAIASGDTSRLERFVVEGAAADCGAQCAVCLGDGTGREPFARALTDRGVVYSTTAEHGTTLIARELYWRLHPPTGLQRLIPLSLRVPPRAIDDLAAAIIAARGAAERDRSDLPDIIRGLL